MSVYRIRWYTLELARRIEVAELPNSGAQSAWDAETRVEIKLQKGTTLERRARGIPASTGALLRRKVADCLAFAGSAAADADRLMALCIDSDAEEGHSIETLATLLTKLGNGS